MNFTSMYYFTVVAEEKNITKAAKRLYISQQSLSKHMLKLENSLGIQLFERKPAFSLTYPGIRFYEAAKQMLYTQDRIVAELNDISSQRIGELRVGISQGRGDLLLPRFMPQFVREHPNTRVRFVQGDRKCIEDCLHYDEIDLVVSFSPIMVDDVESIDVMREGFYLIVPKSLLKEKYPQDYDKVVAKLNADIDLSLFEGCPFILMSRSNRSRTIFERYAASQKFEINLLMEMESNGSLLYLACKDVGITIFPRTFRPLYANIFDDPMRPVEVFPMRDTSTYGKLVVAYKRLKKLDSAAQAFIDAIVRCPEPGNLLNDDLFADGE